MHIDFREDKIIFRDSKKEVKYEIERKDKDKAFVPYLLFGDKSDQVSLRKYD